MPLAGGIVFQVDQAEPAHQALLRHDRQRRQNPGLDCHLRLCAGGDYAQGTAPGTELVPNSTDSERKRI